jgi:protein arginine kinase activator
MTCEECGKNPATVRFEQVINGKRTVMNLCAECAQKRGVFNVLFQPTFSINSLLSALLGSQMKGLPAPSTGEEEIRCRICGMSYRDFARAGRLGCSRCYETFEDRLDPLLRRIHGSGRHIGKAPAKAGGAAKARRELEELRRQLSAAVAQEAYEKAAELRDQIKAVEARIGRDEA